jgi:hypothetical protein
MNQSTHYLPGCSLLGLSTVFGAAAADFAAAGWTPNAVIAVLGAVASVVMACASFLREFRATDEKKAAVLATAVASALADRATKVASDLAADAAAVAAALTKAPTPPAPPSPPAAG